LNSYATGAAETASPSLAFDTPAANFDLGTAVAKPEESYGTPLSDLLSPRASLDSSSSGSQASSAYGSPSTEPASPVLDFYGSPPASPKLSAQDEEVNRRVSDSLFGSPSTDYQSTVYIDLASPLDNSNRVPKSVKQPTDNNVNDEVSDFFGKYKKRNQFIKRQRRKYNVFGRKIIPSPVTSIPATYTTAPDVNAPFADY